MKTEAFDLLVLGAGSGARDGAQRAAREHEAKVALVESTRWGGSCPNVACKPTKAYIVAADLLRDINELAVKIGIDVGPARADLARIKARKDELVGTQKAWVDRLEEAGYTTVEGVASFEAPGTVRVGERLLTADRVLIATGSRTAMPPIEGLEGIDWLDHVSALELTEVPESLLVLGGGPVGLELGQAFARFGARVTIVEGMSQIAARFDRDAADELAASLEGEGIELVCGVHVSKVGRDGAGIVASLDGDERELRAERILLAAGRSPNVEQLLLERVGVEQTEAGVSVDDRMRTTAKGIWAAGDVTGIAQFTPIAQYQARIAVSDMFGGHGARADYSILPTAIFTDPEVAGVGLTETDAREQGLQVATVAQPVSSTQRAKYLELEHGLYKIVYERESRRVLGVHVVCRGASDIVQGLGVAIKLGARVDDLAKAHHAFPTFAEGLKAAAEQA